jgi:hypothetical protein
MTGPRKTASPSLHQATLLEGAVLRMIWLRTGSHDSNENKIALEPGVFNALVRYRARVNETDDLEGT